MVREEPGVNKSSFSAGPILAYLSTVQHNFIVSEIIFDEATFSM